MSGEEARRRSEDDEPGTHVPPVVESGSDEDEDYEQEEEEEEVEEEAASGGSGSEPGALSADEEEVDESLYGSTDGEGDVYELINRAAGAAYARQLEQFPLLRNWTQPPMQHELAVELSMRSAAASPSGAPHPLARGPTGSTLSPPASSSRGSPAGAGVRAPSDEAAAAVEPCRHRRSLNPAHALLLRESRQGSGGGSFQPEQCAHFAAFHRLPSTATRVVDQRQSRGYIGQFTPDGNLFVAAFQHERKIRLYDVHGDWRLKKDIHARGLQWTVTDTALSSDNRFLLYSSITPDVHLVNIASSGGVESVANVTDIHDSLSFLNGGRTQRLGIWSLAWSSNNQEIVAGTSDPGLRVYDLMQRKVVAMAGGHDDDVNAVAYAEPDTPNMIFTGSDDSYVKVWDRRELDASGRRSRPSGVFVGHTEGVTHLDSKGDGRYLISNAKDQSVKLWDTRMMASEKEVKELRRGAPTFSWDYRWMDYPGRGRAVQHPGCRAVQTYRGHSVLSTLIRSYWSPLATTGQRYIYSGSYCGRVHIYDTITAEPVAKLGGYHRECVRDCSWHPHLPLLATVSFDGSVALWEPEVPGAAEAAAEEEEAAAAQQQPGSGRKAGRVRRRGNDLPVPLGDQSAWS